MTDRSRKCRMVSFREFRSRGDLQGIFDRVWSLRRLPVVFFQSWNFMLCAANKIRTTSKGPISSNGAIIPRSSSASQTTVTKSIPIRAAADGPIFTEALRGMVRTIRMYVEDAKLDHAGNKVARHGVTVRRCGRIIRALCAVPSG